MIPKKIHYIWLGNGKPSNSVVRCIDSWKRVMPDYDIKCWNEQSFDVNSVPWVKEAMEAKKWSLASDYIRHYALYNEGGIYMDTDVMVYKPFDVFLSNDFFSSIEYHPQIFDTTGKDQVDGEGRRKAEYDHIDGLGILAACCGAKEGHPFIKECMDYFGNRHFIDSEGKMFLDIINPAVMPLLLEQEGFRYINKEQHLKDGITIYDASVLAGNIHTRTKDSYAMHWCDASWKDDLSFKERVFQWLSGHFPNRFRK